MCPRMSKIEPSGHPHLITFVQLVQSGSKNLKDFQWLNRAKFGPSRAMESSDGEETRGNLLPEDKEWQDRFFQWVTTADDVHSESKQYLEWLQQMLPDPNGGVALWQVTSDPSTESGFRKVTRTNILHVAQWLIQVVWVGLDDFGSGMIGIEVG